MRTAHPPKGNPTSNMSTHEIKLGQTIKSNSQNVNAFPKVEESTNGKKNTTKDREKIN